ERLEPVDRVHQGSAPIGSVWSAERLPCTGQKLVAERARADIVRLAPQDLCTGVDGLLQRALIAIQLDQRDGRRLYGRSPWACRQSRGYGGVRVCRRCSLPRLARRGGGRGGRPVGRRVP